MHTPHIEVIYSCERLSAVLDKCTLHLIQGWGTEGQTVSKPSTRAEQTMIHDFQNEDIVLSQAHVQAEPNKMRRREFVVLRRCTQRRPLPPHRLHRHPTTLIQPCTIRHTSQQQLIGPLHHDARVQLCLSSPEQGVRLHHLAALRPSW